MSPKPHQHVWAYKRPKLGEVTVHRGDEDRFTDVDGWFTVCDRRIGAGIFGPHDHRWLWLEFRTLAPDKVHLCRRCWR